MDRSGAVRVFPADVPVWTVPMRGKMEGHREGVEASGPGCGGFRPHGGRGEHADEHGPYGGALHHLHLPGRGRPFRACGGRCPDGLRLLRLRSPCAQLSAGAWRRVPVHLPEPLFVDHARRAAGFRLCGGAGAHRGPLRHSARNPGGHAPHGHRHVHLPDVRWAESVQQRIQRGMGGHHHGARHREHPDGIRAAEAPGWRSKTRLKTFHMDGQAAKAHERKFHECTFARNFLSWECAEGT